MNLKQITPFVPCTSLERQLAFYRDVLGFSVGFQAEGYAFVSRDAVAVRLVEVSDDVDLKHPERQGSFYIDVEGIDAVFQTMKPALDQLPDGRVRSPFDQPYNQREFHVSDEDCTLIYFGEAIANDN
jgi:catechol 2,3-dioxygenase-like lactoylglutathione lyase family enzyme